jgi:CPA2 family monovalent cation:H+ antiporter-2
MRGHESEILTTKFLMLSAVSFGLILHCLKQLPLVDYILAGLAFGPAGPGLVDYSEEISSLAEFGVILLLFIIGIELSMMAFLRVLRPAVIAASLFLSPLWSGTLHYLVIRYWTHDPAALSSNLAEPA